MAEPIHRRFGVRKIPISDVREIATHFNLDGDFVSAERYGRGHINDTFLVSVNRKNGNARFILQRINEHVFKDPVSLMENVHRITTHLQAKSDDVRSCLSLVSCAGDRYLYDDEKGGFWRAYPFIEGARTFDKAKSTTQAREAAAMFGQFQNLLRDLPPPRLHETIPDFHNTPARYRQFHEALERDSHNRVQKCKTEIDCALAYEVTAGRLIDLESAGILPERIAHNDTKLNNVMFDEESGKAICVIDLDTVMPGLVLYDFGDLVRSATASASEDEAELSQIGMRMDYFKALAEGYLSTAIDFLTAAEIENLPMAGKIITIETGVRFLTDYLAGDRYFRIHSPNQNLDRCKAQFALLASIDAQFEEMQQVVFNTLSEMNVSLQAN